MKSFRSTLIVTLAALVNSVVAGSAAHGQQNELFSSVRSTAPFSSETNTPQATTIAATGRRVTSAGELVRLLEQSDFRVSVAGNRTVTTTKTLDSWEFPVLVTISEDERELQLTLALRLVSDAQKLPAQRLLKLAEENHKTPRASFAYNPERGRLEILAWLNNSSENTARLRDEINRLAILARDTEPLWNLSQTEGGAPPATLGSTGNEASNPSRAGTISAAAQSATPGTPVSGDNSPSATPNPASGVAGNSAPAAASPGSGAPVAAVPPVSASPAAVLPVSAATLQGRWAASRSATEAFAILLNSDNTFVLVSVINGNQARSSGNFTVQNNVLTLLGGDGSQISGSLQTLSSSEFVFTQQLAGRQGLALNFRRAP